MTSRVAVTGMGMVCALGNSVEECRPLLREGTCAIRPLVNLGTASYRFLCGGQATGFAPSNYFTSKESDYLNRFSQLALVAAREAVAQSGLRFSGQLADRSAVITGTSSGGQESEEQGYRLLFINGVTRVSPLTIPLSMANAATSQICLEYGIQGPSYTISTACASSSHAIGQAFWAIREGRLPRIAKGCL